MAKVIPGGWRELAITRAGQGEIETLALLAETLPEDYSVYHAVHWTNLQTGFSVYGEIDFVVMNAAGNLLLIEQKNGFLDETPEGLVKNYGETAKTVSVQMARSRNAIIGKLRRHPDCGAVSVEYLFFCPDYLVRRVESAGISPDRIVDSRRRERVAEIILSVLPEAEPEPAAAHVHRFLCDLVQLQPDVCALAGRAQEMITRVSGGLARWARQLEMDPFRLRVVGTAGSGKTQLALKEYTATLEAGKRPLYVCFNRPLADHIDQIAPHGGLATTFHRLCDLRLRSHGITPDFRQPGIFDSLVRDAAELPVTPDWLFDTVIVDEGQDFRQPWCNLVFRHAQPEARLFWLEDPMQNLLGLPEVALPGWVRLRSNSNYRSPRSVVPLLSSLLPQEQAIDAAGPFLSGEMDVLTYVDGAELRLNVQRAIAQCTAAGHEHRDIALISFRGREGSLLFPFDQIGPYTLRTFTGEYDSLGHPLFSEGQIHLETVYRFKGQAAPAVILAEVDFEELDEKSLRKLFVGITRAMMKLVLIVSERAAEKLLGRLG